MSCILVSLLQVLFRKFNVDLKNNPIYRFLISLFFVSLILHVLILDSIHYTCDHSEGIEICDIKDVHMHSSDQGHSSCNIQLFQIESLKFVEWEIIISAKEDCVEKINNFTNDYRLNLKFYPAHLRGPPQNIISSYLPQNFKPSIG